MKLSRRAGIAAGILILVSAGIAPAQYDESAEIIHDAPDYSRVGPYMQGGVVQAWGQFKAPNFIVDKAILFLDPNDSRLGPNLGVGGRFHKYFAAEIDFEGVWSWTLNGVDTSTYALMLNTKGYYPIGRFQPFALAGIGTLVSLQGNDHTARLAYRFGGGVDVFVTESVYLSVSYRYTGNLDDFGYTNILWGIGYHFD